MLNVEEYVICYNENMTKEKRIWLYRVLAIVFLSVGLIFSVLQAVRLFWPSQKVSEQVTSSEFLNVNAQTYREMKVDDYAMDAAYRPEAFFPNSEAGRTVNPEFASKFSFWVFTNAVDGSTFLFNYHSGMVAKIEHYLSHQESFDGARITWMTSETGESLGTLYFGEYSGYQTKIADGVLDYVLSPDGSTVYYTIPSENDAKTLMLKGFNLSNGTTRLVRSDLSSAVLTRTPVSEQGKRTVGHRFYATGFDGRVVTADEKEAEVLYHQVVGASAYQNLSVLASYGHYVLYPFYAESEAGQGMIYYQFGDGNRIGYAVSVQNSVVHLGSFTEEERYRILLNRSGSETLVVSDAGTYLYRGTERVKIHTGWAEPLLNHNFASYKLSDNILVCGAEHFANLLYAIPRKEEEGELYDLATFDSEALNVFSVSTRQPLLSADGSKFTMNYPYTTLPDFRANPESEEWKETDFGVRTQTVYAVATDGQISYVTPEGYVFDWIASNVSSMDAVSFATNASGNIQVAIVPGTTSAYASPTLYITNFSQGTHLLGVQEIPPVQVIDSFFGDRFFYVARDEQSKLTLAMVVISENQSENEHLENEYVEEIQGYHWYGQSAVCINSDGNLIFIGSKIIQTDLQVTSFFD